jgi:hypothetical protein
MMSLGLPKPCPSWHQAFAAPLTADSIGNVLAQCAPRRRLCGRLGACGTAMQAPGGGEDGGRHSRAGGAVRRLAVLGALGASLGPSCDALHNQVLLVYDILPVQIEAFGNVAKSSLLIPPLLALTYCLLGGVFPALVGNVVGSGQVPWQQSQGGSGTRAGLAVASTALIIKSSEVLATAGAPASQALGMLVILALLQWAILDGAYASLVLAIVLSIGEWASDAEYARNHVFGPSSHAGYASTRSHLQSCAARQGGPWQRCPSWLPAAGITSHRTTGRWHFLVMAPTVVHRGQVSLR